MMLDDEVQLAPWNITKNFILATQAKGMVKLYGGGDPTSRGEGFSFFRASMKEMFMRAGSSSAELAAYQESIKQTGHRFVIADQQKVYRAETERIWLTQRRVLSSTEEPELSDDEGAARRHRGDEPDDLMEEESQDFHEMMSMIQSMDKSKSTMDDMRLDSPVAGSSSAALRSQFPSQVSLDDKTLETGSLASSRHFRSKSLLIRRKQVNEDGVEEWHEEVVLDSRITNAYLKQRRLMQGSSSGFSAIGIDDDDETRKKKMVKELKLLKREYGKPTAQPLQPKIEADGKIRLGVSQRGCRSCGQIGHIKTNRYACVSLG
jgi:transcription initiation factor TFIID subunit 1